MLFVIISAGTELSCGEMKCTVYLWSSKLGSFNRAPISKKTFLYCWKVIAVLFMLKMFNVKRAFYVSCIYQKDTKCTKKKN